MLNVKHVKQKRNPVRACKHHFRLSKQSLFIHFIGLIMWLNGVKTFAMRNSRWLLFLEFEYACAHMCVCECVCVVNNGNLRRKFTSRWKASKFFNNIANQKQTHTHTHSLREGLRDEHVLFFLPSLTSAFSWRIATRDIRVYTNYFVVFSMKWFG